MEQEGLRWAGKPFFSKNAPICSMGSCVQWLLQVEREPLPTFAMWYQWTNRKRGGYLQIGWRCTLTEVKVDYAAVYSRLSPLSCLIIEGNQDSENCISKTLLTCASNSASGARGTCGDVDKGEATPLYTSVGQMITSSNTGSQWHGGRFLGPPCAAQHPQESQERPLAFCTAFLPPGQS